jgi:hypothetical protein
MTGLVRIFTFLLVCGFGYS